MVNSGKWKKAGYKTYKHCSGTKIAYRNNQRVWEIKGGPADGLRFENLWATRDEVEKGQQC